MWTVSHILSFWTYFFGGFVSGSCFFLSSSWWEWEGFHLFHISRGFEMTGWGCNRYGTSNVKLVLIIPTQLINPIPDLRGGGWAVYWYGLAFINLWLVVWSMMFFHSTNEMGITSDSCSRHKSLKIVTWPRGMVFSARNSGFCDVQKLFKIGDYVFNIVTSSTKAWICQRWSGLLSRWNIHNWILLGIHH